MSKYFQIIFEPWTALASNGMKEFYFLKSQIDEPVWRGLLSLDINTKYISKGAAANDDYIKMTDALWHSIFKLQCLCHNVMRHIKFLSLLPPPPQNPCSQFQ